MPLGEAESGPKPAELLEPETVAEEVGEGVSLDENVSESPTTDPAITELREEAARELSSLEYNLGEIPVGIEPVSGFQSAKEKPAAVEELKRLATGQHFGAPTSPGYGGQPVIDGKALVLAEMLTSHVVEGRDHILALFNPDADLILPRNLHPRVGGEALIGDWIAQAAQPTPAMDSILASAREHILLALRNEGLDETQAHSLEGNSLTVRPSTTQIVRNTVRRAAAEYVSSALASGPGSATDISYTGRQGGPRAVIRFAEAQEALEMNRPYLCDRRLAA